MHNNCEPDVNWAIISRKFLEENKKTGVVGAFYHISKTASWIQKAWFDMRKGVSAPVSFLPAGNCVVRGEEFLSIGGFSEELVTCEDYDLCARYQKKGFIVWNSTQIKSIHFGNRTSLYHVFKGEAWFGQGMLKSMSGYKYSKPFIASNMFLLGLMLLAVGFIIKIINFSQGWEIMSLGLALWTFPILLYAIIGTLKSGKPFNFFLYLPIFTCYLAGRAFSLYYIYLNKNKRLK